MKEMQWDSRYFYGGRAGAQWSTGTADLDANSPLKRAAELKLPVLLVHGTWDINVNIDHSKSMSKALARNGHRAKLVTIEHGDHSLSKPSMRLTLFQELETFLAAHLGTH
jgi:dipeptidyl aminopeptidase/acylaminoacyl peptidase